MKNALTLAGRTGVLSLLSLSAGQALAGGNFGSVSHSPDFLGIPMLGGAGLMILSALLGLVSLRFLKDRKHNGGTFVIAAALTGALAAAGGGVKLISDAHAAPTVSLKNGQGGTITLPFEGINLVINDSGVPQQITDITAVNGCYIASNFLMMQGGGNGGFVNGGENGGSFRGECSDDTGDQTILNPGDRCDVLVCCVNGGTNGGNGGGCFVR